MTETVAKYVLGAVEKLDSVCLKVDIVYRNHPMLLKGQAFFSMFFSLILLHFSNLGAYIYQKTPFFVHCFIWVIVVVYYTGMTSFLTSVKRQPYELQSRMRPYLRPIIQWVMVELVKNIAAIAEGRSHLADWLATVSVFMLLCHVITIVKLYRRLNDFGAIDGLISVAIAFTMEVSGNMPWVKIGLTLFFALLMALREHRAKIRRNEETAQNRISVVAAWMINRARQRQQRLTCPPNPAPPALPPPDLGVPSIDVQVPMPMAMVLVTGNLN